MKCVDEGSLRDVNSKTEHKIFVPWYGKYILYDDLWDPNGMKVPYGNGRATVCVGTTTPSVRNILTVNCSRVSSIFGVDYHL